MNVLKNLTDEMLEKILPITQLSQLKEGDIVFEENENADRFYMLKRGKLILETNVSDTIRISLCSIKPGYSFGWSSVIENPSYYASAVSVEPTDILVIPAEKLLDLMNSDHAMGHMIMKGLAEILRSRLKKRTTQFLKVMSRHPDIQKFIGPSD